MKYLFSVFLSIILLLPVFAQRLDVVTFTGSEKSGFVSCYILTSGRESILVDAPISKKDARRLTDTITRLNRHITAILITHAHPDHYLGASEIKMAFPNIRVMAISNVTKEIERSAPAIYDIFKSKLGNDMPAPLVLPDSIVESVITLGKVTIQVKEILNAESESTTVLYEPISKSLFASDVVYNKVHLNMLEQRIDGWLQQLQELKKYDVYKIFPGHGSPGDELLFDDCINYIQTFKKSLPTNDPIAINDIMNNYFPGYKMEANLKASIAKFLIVGVELPK